MDIASKSKTISIPDNTVLNPIAADYLKGSDYSLNEIEGELVSEEELSQRIKTMAKEIARDFSPKNSFILWVKDGAEPFFKDLYGHLSRNGANDFLYDGIKVNSYYGTKAGALIVEDFDWSKVKGKHVLFVEDIVDTGATGTALGKKALEEHALSTSMASMVTKRTPKSNGYCPEYAGFSIPNKFIIGKGLDYNQEYRSLPSICVISDIGIEKYALK